MANTFVSINKLHPVLQEIAKQTDIDRFMEPYDAAKVKRAAELNALVYKTDIHKPVTQSAIAKFPLDPKRAEKKIS